MRAIPARYKPSGMSMAGGMASVAVYQDTVLERPVAIKFLQSSSHKRRMQDEVAALLKLRSKHVVQLYDVIQARADEIGIVQEFIDGKDLFESYVPPADLAAYYKQVWQIASGIAEIHQLGVIHRDIKPNNMKTDPEGVIKIFDFGLARDEGPQAATMGFVGTRGFAAPELYHRPYHFTNAVDTYAFGATALFLAAGTLPDAMMHQPPTLTGSKYFASLPLGIAPDVAALLDACISAEPAARPPMADVRHTLAQHILFNRHRALVVFNGQASVLSSDNPTVALNYAPIGQISIRYTGLAFVVDSVSGEVQVNNQTLAPGTALPGACVVALGGSHRRPGERRFITFDISHPEIVL
jgi:eukaryotic-like serine/threonine-protein kinase